MELSIKELANRRRKWVEANCENGFEAGINRLLTDLYPDNAHFIYELLQNAEDAGAQKVRFTLHRNSIEFEHDGKRLFSPQDIDAITSIGCSTKRDDVTRIGKFGVGFKAVFAYTNSPEVESGGFHFRIRDMVVPEPVDSRSHNFNNQQTRFIFPFDNPKKPSDQAQREIKTLLEDLDATALLFLTHIHRIEYVLPDSSLGYLERTNQGHGQFEICVKQPNELTPVSSWFLKFDKEVEVEDEEAETETSRVKRCRIAISFGLARIEAESRAKKKKGGESDNAFPEWELTSIERGCVCIYFPAATETSNLRFHLHAPFASTVARDSIRRDCPGNRALRDHLAELLAESMHTIRDLNLLTVKSLAILPNDKDSLPLFYLPLENRLKEEFSRCSLVPMKSGEYAAALDIFRGTKALSDFINDGDMVTLLGDNYCSPMWAANPSQKNQREDNFLSMLNIEHWDIADLVDALNEMDLAARAEWMGSKDDAWHQTLYEMLMDYLSAVRGSEARDRRAVVSRINLIRCSDQTYRKGHECYFPSGTIEIDESFPRVAKGVYVSDDGESKKVRDFFEMIGVRAVDEVVEMEALLKTRYSKGALNRKLNDMLRFVEFTQKYPKQIEIFQEFYIFKLKNGKWGLPQDLYLDMPYMETGLNTWYVWQGEKADKWPLSDDYQQLSITPAEIGEFAKKLNASTELEIQKTEVSTQHPEWNHLNANGGCQWTEYFRDEDYHIPGLSDFLACPDLYRAMLVWRTIKNLDKMHYIPYWIASFGRNRTHLASAKSTLFYDLTRTKWVPQQEDDEMKFVEPCDVEIGKLPASFEYNTEWQWLDDLEFGKRIKEREQAQWREQQSQTAAYKKKEEVIREMGFSSVEEVSEIAELLKEDPEFLLQWKKRGSIRKESPMFPTKSVANPQRRQKRLSEQISDAPDKEYQKRERSVRATNSTIDPITWLREQYTNKDEQMVCQICKDEMPFRKRDGTYYFEKKEVLSRKYLTKEHEAQYLALCPICAAKYEEFVKSDDEVMAELKEAILNAEDWEVPISLAGQETSIRFVETHYYDIRSILRDMS